MQANHNLVQRLRTAQGHLDAVCRMVEGEERSCVDVLHQLSAVQGALSVVRRELLEQHLRERLEFAPAADEVDDLVEDILAATFGGPVRTAHTSDYLPADWRVKGLH